MPNRIQLLTIILVLTALFSVLYLSIVVLYPERRIIRDVDTPIAPSPDLPNAPPPDFGPVATRCNWYVVCGRYIISEEDDNFSPGESLEIELYGGLVADISKSHPSPSPCYPYYGRWEANRIIDENSNHNLVKLEISYDCSRRAFRATCTVEVIQIFGRVDETRLVCSQGWGIWILCQENPSSDYLRNHC